MRSRIVKEQKRKMGAEFDLLPKNKRKVETGKQTMLEEAK